MINAGLSDIAFYRKTLLFSLAFYFTNILVIFTGQFGATFIEQEVIC
jgi:hypothetical protein